MDQMTFQQLTDELMRLYPQGKYADALEVVEQNADRFPEQSARTTYWKMCLLSLCRRTDDLYAIFRESLDAGMWWAEKQFKVETDFDPVRDLPEFKQLVAESDRKCIEMQEQLKSERAILEPDDMSGDLPLLIFLHGRNGNKDSHLEDWESARQRGWLVMSIQSRQGLFPGSFCWDDSEKGFADILFHVEEIQKLYAIDPDRIVMAGFSQGSGMSIYTALSGKVKARGFIGVATFIAEPDVLLPYVREPQSVRGYFIVGEKDHTLEKARAIQRIMRKNNIPFAEEVYPELAHEFPPDFASSFDRAIKFIFE